MRRTLKCASDVCKLPRRGPYIATIGPADAEGELQECYARYAKPDGGVDNIDKVHSLNPMSMVSHNTLYKQCMKDDSPLTFIEREVIAVTVSRVNQCGY